jgi:hypothetical protein
MAHATTSGKHARHSPPRPEAPKADPPEPVEHLPPTWNPKPATPGLPLGVAILSLVIAATGLIVFLAGALVFLNSYVPDTVPPSLLIFPAVDLLGAAILILVGTVFVGVANALWHQEVWALYLTVGALFAGETYLFFTATITVLFVLLLLVFVYLLTVRQHFY